MSQIKTDFSKLHLNDGIVVGANDNDSEIKCD